MVFVDHAAEDLPAPHWRIKGHDDWLVMMGWPLLRGLNSSDMPTPLPNGKLLITIR